MSADTFASGRAVPVDPSDTVESLADVAIARWSDTGAYGFGQNRGTFRAHHDPRSCGCLACADGRSALDLPALSPQFNRRSFPETAP